MSIKKFSEESGFKVLAMARLSQTEYAIVLYLLNCAISNLDEVITTDTELSSLIGFSEDEVRKAVDQLSVREIVKVRYGTPHANPDIDSMRIGMQFNINAWQLDFKEDVNSKDAVVFPFRRRGETSLFVYKDEETTNTKHEKDAPTWRRIFDSFVQGRSLDEDEILATEAASTMLVDTHPVDQVLLMVRHFGGRIPTLSLLASSWQHYHELFEEETQKVDILGARQKHLELDASLRDTARELLTNSDSDYSDEERTVLEILSKHRHPRRQLFWAYQMRSRYPNLAEFFDKNCEMMLPVTNSGKILKKNNINLEDT